MYVTSPKTRSIVPGAYAGSPLLPQKDAWDVLEGYARSVAACEKAADQTHQVWPKYSFCIFPLSTSYSRARLS